MSHLSAERLAALTDEPPTASELAHLAGCALCARERQAFDNLRSLGAVEQLRIAAPLTSFDAIRPALRRDGVIDIGDGRLRPRRRPQLAWLQVAAALLLIAAGVAAGRFSAGASPIPLQDTPAIATTPAQGAAKFASIEEARRARAQSELLYQQAAAWLAENDSTLRAPESPAVMRTRLAALESVGETMREALDMAPHDPVINNYYLTTLGQREATLRQLATSLPDGVRMNSF